MYTICYQEFIIKFIFNLKTTYPLNKHNHIQSDANIKFLVVEPLFAKK